MIKDQIRNPSVYTWFPTKDETSETTVQNNFLPNQQLYDL